MTKKRHLRDLYVRGTIHTIDDGSGDPVSVYLKKLNLSENEEAMRRANAARAVLLASLEDADSDFYMATLGDVMDESREDLIEDLISEPLARKREAVEAEVSAGARWSDDDYLQGLSDAWVGGLAEKFQEDSEDPEAKKVFEVLKEFADEVEVILEGEAEALRRDYEHVPDEELYEKSVRARLKMRADVNWVDIYRRMELFLATRDPEDHKERYFDDLNDLYDLETPVLLDLLMAYRDLTVEPAEGKDLPETPTS